MYFHLIFSYIDARYHYVKIVDDEAIFWTSTIIFGKLIKKFDVWSIEEEQKMLM